MKILLSPAKSIQENAGKLSWSNAPKFEKEAAQLVKSLKKMKSTDLQELMDISADLAELNVSRFKNWRKVDVNDETFIAAALAFTGEVYRGLQFSGLTEEQQLKADEKIRILSGLYGVLKPSDLIFPYRLEMGTSFSPLENQRNLYQFWDAKVTKAILKETGKEEVVVNLASNEYFKVIQTKLIQNTIITPVFKEFKNGKFSIVMMYAKHARGAMARYLIENELSSIEELKLYNVDGYSYDDNLSKGKEWVFVR